MNRVSRVTNGLIRHRLLERARDIYIPLCRDATDGVVLLLVGPTQSGKSIILNELTSLLRNSFKDDRPGAIPVVDLQIETVSEGRTKPKWLGIELLKSLNHPMYKHIGSLEEYEHYMPSKGRDEGTVRIALKEGLTNRFTRRVCLDEVHLLTRTKDPELRAAILESIKSTCAIDRTLIACGGYEIAYKGLFDSSHFCGRVISFDFGSYSASVPDDVESWMRLLATYGSKLELQSKNVLMDQAEDLLRWNNGTVGLLDKHLWACSVHAKALHQRVDKAILRACAPLEAERKSIARDIALGKAALQPSSSVATPTAASPACRSDTTPPRGHKGNKDPFQRRPDRNAAEEIALHGD